MDWPLVSLVQRIVKICWNTFQKYLSQKLPPNNLCGILQRFRATRFCVQIYVRKAVLRIRIQGPGVFFTPGYGIPGWVKNQDPDPGSGVNIPRAEKHFSGLKILKCLCCGCASGIWNLFDSGSGIRDGKIRIRDKHPGSATPPEIDLSPSTEGRYRTGQHLPKARSAHPKKPNYVSQSHSHNLKLNTNEINSIFVF